MRRDLLTLAAVLAALAGCSGWLARSEGVDPSTLPENLRADYAVFAQRCSKCHSLARPLSSGIDDDDYWAMYVARMRRQPGSGISQEDTVVVLRFLHYYSEEQRRKKDKHDVSPPPPSQPPAPPVAPASPAPPAAVTPSPSSVSSSQPGGGGGG